jgi:hypothetical protein
MTINEIAKSYLANQPSLWLNLAKGLCREVSTWIVTQVDRAGGTITEAELLDILLPELLSPALITVVAGSRNPRLAQEFIALTINEQIKGAPTGISLDIVDWGFDSPIASDILGEDDDDIGISVKRSSYLDDDRADLDPPGFSANVMESYYDEPKLTSMVSKFLDEKNIIRIMNESTASAETRVDSVFRLDFVDLALYKALLAHPDLLRSIDWRTFEKLLADILDSFGYEVELQRGTKDGGVDLFAVKKVDPFGPQRFLLQAKRWANKVGVETVRELAFLHDHHKVTKSCLATTATFTSGAWELANQYKWRLELRDFKGLQEWIQEAATIKAKF